MLMHRTRIVTGAGLTDMSIYSSIDPLLGSTRISAYTTL